MVIVWDVIKRIRIRVQRVHEANAQELHHEFMALVWKETEDFTNRITRLVVDPRLLEVNDSEVVWNMCVGHARAPDSAGDFHRDTDFN